MSDSTYDPALRQIGYVLSAGQRILFVLGAGASAGANVPLMREVYASLALCLDHKLKILNQDETETRLSAAIARLKDLPSNERNRVIERLKRLYEELGCLAKGGASQCVAARVLGTLQKASSGMDTDAYDDVCAELWFDFSKQFIAGDIKVDRGTVSQDNPAAEYRFNLISDNHNLLAVLAQTNWHQARPETPITSGSFPNRTPTLLHYLVAGLVVTRHAHVMSLNFDGLTQRAIETIGNRDYPARTVRAIVASDDQAVRNLWLGASKDSQAILPVYKIWGDVFHMVCINPRCPEFDHRIPIFLLISEKSKDSHLTCPACKCARQLAIYFAGYEEKEIQSQSMLRTLLGYLAPQVGCVVTVGVSGLWDKALGDFIVQLCRSVEANSIFKYENSRNDPSMRPSFSCICVDPSDSYLSDELNRQNIKALHLRCNGDAFANLFQPSPQLPIEMQATRESGKDSIRSEHLLEDMHWKNQITVEQPLPHVTGLAKETYDYLRDQDGCGYLKDFRFLQQLGIKTTLCNRDSDKVKRHNRHCHSLGATTLAALWLNALQEGSSLIPRSAQTGLSMEVVSSLAILAVRHHDIGHLPFTHLMEEIFDEVHWVTYDYGRLFKHDEPVLFELQKSVNGEAPCFETSVSSFFKDVSDRIIKEQIPFTKGVSSDRKASFLRYLVELYCQGRSGVPWIDAMINSPLDVDKLDYVFRDCEYLEQGLHIKDPQKSWPWVEPLFRSCRLLPSGLVALSGASRERARDFIEERIWLYQRVYFQIGFRAIERIVKHAVMQWLIRSVAASLGRDLQSAFQDSIVYDTRASKGKRARLLLWRLVRKVKGPESDQVLAMIDETLEEDRWRIPIDDSIREWLIEAKSLLGKVFVEGESGFSAKGARQHDQLLADIRALGVAASDRLYVRMNDLRDTREYIRRLEQEQPCTVLFDIAVLPRALSYPNGRRFNYGQQKTSGECFVVPDKDPDKWHRSTNRWIPLSESAYAMFDKERWAAIMAVAIGYRDDLAQQGMDRLRLFLRTTGKDYEETEQSFGILGRTLQ